MNFLRKKIKRGAISCLALTMSATLAAGVVLMDFGGGKNSVASADTAQNVSFREVTGQYDTNSLVEQNFNSAVLQSNEKSYETRTVIVSLGGNSLTDDANGEYTVADYLNTPLGRQSLKRINGEQSAFLSALSMRGIKYTLKNTYSAVVNAVAVEIDTSYVSQIKKMGLVESAVISRTYSVPKTVKSGSVSSITNNANVYKTGIYDSSAVAGYDWGTGAGTVVAILDTGLDYTHPAFQTVPSKLGMDKDYIQDKISGTTAFAHTVLAGGTMEVDDVYLSDKVPFAYDYADNDFDVYPSYSNHGAHVAGIVAGYDENGYDDKDGNHINEVFKGVAPEAQLVICKTFTDDLESEDIGGAVTEDIIAALDDCVVLGVDVINMSLGTTAGFTSTDDGDPEGDLMDKTYSSVQSQGISLICAASNDYSAGYGSIFGTNLATNPDSGTVGSPSTFFSALSVASISGQRSKYMVAGDGTEAEEYPIFYEEARDGNSVEYDFVGQMLEEGETKKTYEYVVVGKGEAQDYSTTVRNLLKDRATGESLGRLALIERGSSTFLEKIELAYEMGAIGALVYNNVSGVIRMSLGEITKGKDIPAVSITMDAGKELVSRARNGQSRRVGSITLDTSLDAGPFMSEFSSWGTTPDLKLKPEITAHGGEITSTVPGGYGEQSGTSMACPNMAGLTALVRNLVKTILPDDATPTQITQLTNQLIMSTATTVVDQFGLEYSPRKQGSGLASIDNIVNTNAYLFTDEDCGKTGGSYNYWYDGLDGRPKIELGADKDKKGEYTFTFKIKNFGVSALTFDLNTICMTETLASDNLAVAEKAYKFTDINPSYSQDGNSVSGNITVGAGATSKITVSFSLSDADKKYINDKFKNGMFVEGFVQLKGTGSQCQLSIPYLSFFGDWDNLPMLDYNCFEIADSQRDTSVEEEDKLNATVFATQPYAAYSNNSYVIPIGNYVYVQDETADQIYTTEEHCAISRYNEFRSDAGIDNYYTATQIRCLYAGLFRSARKVEWTLYDAYTGEEMKSDTKNRISKAYANGGSSVPGFVDLRLTPEELGLVNNGKYRMKFDFYFNENSEYSDKNSFEFNFYVDYDAPVLQDARLRYQNETSEGSNKIKQRIFIDLDVYDNHYAQSVMLAYIDTSGVTQELKLATEYFAPVYNSVKNGTNTVSIEVTDIWETYKNRLVVQVDDYALNHATYVLGAFNDPTLGESDVSLNANVTPATFELAEGEEQITVGVNETHIVSLVYDGNANLSNFEWISNNPYVKVKNGEIVGVTPTSKTPARVTVSNRKGVTKSIQVTVVDNGKQLGYPSISFGPIQNFDDSLVKAQGGVRVAAGKDIKLNVLTDPWYYPNKLNLEWSTDNPTVATVDQEGNVHTITKGTAIIRALIKGTAYSTSVSLYVQDEFTVSNMSLTEYNGDGVTVDGQEGVVIIPSDKNIMTIGERAFEGNTKITKVIIPKTVTEIGERAFDGCSNLKEVCFINDNKDDDYTSSDFVADAELKLIRKYAFKGCAALETLDLHNCKVISVAHEAFMNCTNLKTIIKSSAIGTAYDRAFLGCSSLQSLDLSGLHVAGSNVFGGCTSLESVITDKFTAIGYEMFAPLTYRYSDYNYSTASWDLKVTEYAACTALDNLVIKTASVGEGAFKGCTNLSNVEFSNVIGGVPDSTVVFNISDNAFLNCTSLSSVTFNGAVKKIGASAFKNTALTSVTLPDGLITLGAEAFGGTNKPTVLGGGDYTVSGDFILSKDGTVLLLYTGSAQTCTIPASVTEISANAFAGSSITTLTIPSSVAKIGEGAFMGGKLSSVTINANLTEIPAYCFYGTQITSVTLPASVTYVGDYAFGNSNISTFNFSPASGAELGSFVFGGCTDLVNISLDGKISVLGDGVFLSCTSLETASLPALVSLGAYTFTNTPALTTVTFAAGATVTGTYTFAALSAEDRQNLTTVTLGASLSKIGEGAFYNCANLASINLGGAEEIETSAFFGCTSLATVTGLENVEIIGTLAFYNCNALTGLSLSATQIGDGAFLIDNGGAAYTSVSVPNAVTLGEYAFAGGNESTVTIPATLKEIGGGAFAASKNLTSFVIDNNSLYFLDGNVLYRYITQSEYELVAYPSGLAAQTLTDDFANGKKTYKIIDGTVSVAASAFEGLKTGAIEHVILPYTLKVIGSGAFFNSGICEYRFESINAPVLLNDYADWIEQYIEDEGGAYIGYYYSNFQDYFVYHTQFGGAAKPATLKIFRPENGVGYTTHIYSLYFAQAQTTGVNIDDTTRECRDLILALPTASEVSGWSLPNKPKSEVEEFSALVKRIRTLRNSVTNASQLEILGEENTKRLEDVEIALRAVKSAYGIPVIIESLTRVDGSYKDTYYSGDKFDMRGLQVIVNYDDSSSEIIGSDKLTLETTGELTVYDRDVVVSYEGVECYLVVSVYDRSAMPAPAPAGGCGNVSDSTDSLLISFAGLTAMLLLATVLRRKMRITND